MHCTVWRSSRKELTYLYLALGQAFEDLPEALQATFGAPEFVLKLALSPERKLANADVGQVMENLAAQGYHLQLPPETPVEEIIRQSLG